MYLLWVQSLYLLDVGKMQEKSQSERSDDNKGKINDRLLYRATNRIFGIKKSRAQSGLILLNKF